MRTGWRSVNNYLRHHHDANAHGARYRVKEDAGPAWIAMLVLQGGHFGSDKRTTKKMWWSQTWSKEDVAVPTWRLWYTLRSQLDDTKAYDFMRSYIHFTCNSKQKKHQPSLSSMGSKCLLHVASCLGHAQSANLLGIRGRELFTDNYYTSSMKLAKPLFKK